MRARFSALRSLLAEQKAATAVEYGLIVALIVLAMLAGFQAVGTTTIDMWSNVSSKVVNAR